MRKHGWQLPYHPLQVVAVAVFFALGVAFYVFFVPFVGNKLLEYVVIGIYSILVTCVFGLYIWCAATDPADPGVFKSKKSLHLPENGKHSRMKGSKLGGDSSASLHNANASFVGEKSMDKGAMDIDAATNNRNTNINNKASFSAGFMGLLAFTSFAFLCNCCRRCDESSEKQTSEDGMFYCSLCEVKVCKYSKHCRVCDKCVDQFDHHCRWLNNCIGKKNYRKFFTLMVSSLLLLILQWSTGVLVLICCFLERKRFAVDVASKLGRSFTLVPFVIVVAVCTILAMIATLPLAQLFFFHILLIKKGISTYDYVIALREQEQEQQGGGTQSPQMSPVSSLTALSSASSFTTFHRNAWCTPPHQFLEDQFDVFPPETGSVSSLRKRTAGERPVEKKNPGAVKISAWALARLNAEEVSKAAAEARKKSKTMQPVVRRNAPFLPEADSSAGSRGRQMLPRPDNNGRRSSKRVRIPAELSIDPLMMVSGKSADRNFTVTSTSLAPLQLEARNAFHPKRAMSNSMRTIASSPESSLESPAVHSFRISSSEPEDARKMTGLLYPVGPDGIPPSRPTSDGYDASGGEDSDHVPQGFVQRPTNWSNIFFSSDEDQGELIH